MPKGVKSPKPHKFWGFCKKYKLIAGCILALVVCAYLISIVPDNIPAPVSTVVKLQTPSILKIDSTKVVIPKSDPKKYVTIVEFSGDVSLSWVESLRDALKDASCMFVIAIINSPGGGVEESMEVAHGFKVLQTQYQKPVFAYTNRGMFSGAYMVGVNCPIIGVSPGCDVGSIGVYWIHQDDTEKWRRVGTTFDIIKSGENKISMSEFNTLTPAQRQIIQDLVNDSYESFLNIILSNRSTRICKAIYGQDFVLSVQDTLHVICDGRIYSPRTALNYGFIDVVLYFDDFVKSIYGAYGLSNDLLLKRGKDYYNVSGEKMTNYNWIQKLLK